MADDHDLLIEVNTNVKNILKILETIPALESRVSCIEGDDKARDEKISTMKNEVDKLRTNNNAWSFGNTLGVIVAGILAVLIK